MQIIYDCRGNLNEEKSVWFVAELKEWKEAEGSSQSRFFDVWGVGWKFETVQIVFWKPQGNFFRNLTNYPSKCFEKLLRM